MFNNYYYILNYLFCLFVIVFVYNQISDSFFKYFTTNSSANSSFYEYMIKFTQIVRRKLIK